MAFAVLARARCLWGHAPRVRSAVLVRRGFASVSDGGTQCVIPCAMLSQYETDSHLIGHMMSSSLEAGMLAVRPLRPLREAALEQHSSHLPCPISAYARAILHLAGLAKVPC